LNNQKTELLLDLLANPADKDTLHTDNLKALVNEYPQSGLLHALLTQLGEHPNLQQAAVYYNPKILYKLNKDIDALPSVAEGQLLLLKEPQSSTGYFHAGEYEPELEAHTEEPLLAPWEGEEDIAVAEEDHQPETKAEELPELVPDANYEAAQHPETDIFREDVNAPAATPETFTPIDEPVYDEIGETSHETAAQLATEITEPAVVAEQASSPVAEPVELKDNTIIEHEPVTHNEIPVPQPAPVRPIEDDVFDEIVSIDDINLAVQEYYSTVVDQQSLNTEPVSYNDIYAEALKAEESPVPAAPAEPVEEATKDKTVFGDRKVDLTDEAEKLILNNIAATDFFVFDKAFGEKKRSEEIPAENTEPVAPVEAAPMTASAEEQAPVDVPAPPVGAEIQPAQRVIRPYENVSKYHDEKMPYSFMWWLDKTRREHSGIYQPFVEFKLDTTQNIKPVAPADELQQQYIESIFQLNTVEDLERGTEQPVVHFDSKKKEDEIIERFIQEVPQIKPQSADKLDNENKARKSSEDQDELVTETLAQIYIDQMLYPKAIDTYRKLMLKFPEKSRYFAGQIEQLEKK